MTKRLFAMLLAGTLLVPLISPALGNESTVGLGTPGHDRLQGSSWGAFTLPPVPYLDTMPWLKSGSALKGPKVDILLDPKLEPLGPLLGQPAIPTAHTSSSWQSFEPSTSTE
jgi:hypothetical protein